MICEHLQKVVIIIKHDFIKKEPCQVNVFT